MPGKPWSAEEEAELRRLVDAAEPLNIIASKFGMSEGAVREKCKRLGLRVVVSTCRRKITTREINLPVELPSVEEALKILAGALEAAAEPDLDQVEIRRLHVVATLAKTYKELLADYINYRDIEAKLVEMEKKYARLAEKAQSNAS